MKHFTVSCLLLISFLLAQDAKTISAQEGKTPTLVSVHAEEAFLPGILSVLAKESGYNIVTDPNVNKQDKVSIHLDDVPIEQAINLVVRAVEIFFYILHIQIF